MRLDAEIISIPPVSYEYLRATLATFETEPVHLPQYEFPESFFPHSNACDFERDGREIDRMLILRGKSKFIPVQTPSHGVDEAPLFEKGISHEFESVLLPRHVN